ncbi:MAG: hypothetical protein I8H68_07500 [Flavobacteriia bacterium]|nr:hypothetical protein [Flavobacteriia bacterium]
MNYNQFSKKENVIDTILTQFGILTTKKIIIKIDHEPDYEISEYMKERETNYYFYNAWSFKNKFSFVVNVNVNENHIFHYDNFEQLSDEYNIPFYLGNECEFLLNIWEEDSDAFQVFGFGTDTDNFRINNFRIRAVDNLEGNVYYDGSFYGSGYEINQNDFAVYSMIDVNAVPLYIDEKPFYNSLLAESYLLLKEKSYKLSYFLLFSALESFINYELGKGDVEGRLKDKLNELLTSKFQNLAKHQIYSCIIHLFDDYTRDRNTIAHGRNSIDVDQKIVEELFLFVLTMISSYVLDSSTFEDLFKKITE